MSVNTTDESFPFDPVESQNWSGTVKTLFYGLATFGTASLLALTPSLCRLELTHYIIPTYRAGYLELENNPVEHYANAPLEFMNYYSYKQSDADSIVRYIKESPVVQVFLTKMSGIIDKIYPGLGDKKYLNFIEDPDNGESLLELVFDSGLPIDEEFFEKDRMVYNEIEVAGIEEGLNNIVFVNT